MSERILTATLPSTYANGQVIYGADLNKIVTVLRGGVNFNKNDIDKMLHGENSDYVFETLDARDDFTEVTTPDDGQICFVLTDEADLMHVYTWDDAGAEWLDSGTFSLVQIRDRLAEIEEDLWDRSYSSTWYNGTGVSGYTSNIPATLGTLDPEVSINDYYMNDDTGDIYKCVSVDGATTYWSWEANIQGTSFRERGIWDTNTSYFASAKFQDVVYYAGSQYYCKETITTGLNDDPVTDTARWGIFVKQGTSFRGRGEWNALTDYVTDGDHIDVVSYLGDNYYCKASIAGNASNDNPLVDTASWGVYTEKGISFRTSDWDEDTSYYSDNDYIDIVHYLGKSYYCKSSISGTGNQAPSLDTSHWGIFVDNTMGTDLDASSTAIAYTLEDNEDKTFTQASLSGVAITLPATIAHGFVCAVNYKSGVSPVLVTFTNNSGLPLKLIKYGFIINNYTPTASRTVILMFHCDGINVYCHIEEVA